MTQAEPLSQRAESSIELIHRTVGLHRRQMTSLLLHAHRTRVRDPGFDAVQIQRQATYLRIVSITEAFCADRLVEVAEASMEPTANPIRAQVWDQAAVSATSNWDSIQTAFKNWHNARPTWSDVNRLAEVRNAIAHGLGSLTRRQQASPKSLGLIRESQVTLDGSRVVLDESDIDHATESCIELIDALDGMTR